jgi:ribosomal protein S15P/S13E
MVSKRRRLLFYLQKKDAARFTGVSEKLELSK